MFFFRQPPENWFKMFIFIVVRYSVVVDVFMMSFNLSLVVHSLDKKRSSLKMFGISTSLTQVFNVRTV